MVPALQFSHSHQGWLDTAMAIGWIGVGILFLLYAHLMLIGWRALQPPEARPWAVGLLLVAAFWILRGFADSVYREHYLQMQAFVLAYLYLNVREKCRIKKCNLADEQLSVVSFTFDKP
jgi:O-antigen ligase